jgi:hypothetical protein
MSPAPLVLLLAAIQGAAASSEPVLSWELARSLAQKIETLKERERAKPRTGAATPPAVVVTEGELNSYLNLSLAEKMPAGLADVLVQLDRDHIAARAMVDLEKVGARTVDAGRWSPLSYLTGRVPVEVKGRYRHAQEGFGALEVEEVRLATLPVPLSLIEQMVSSAARAGSSPVDIQAPFRLPYAAKRLRVQKGQARLEF